MAFPIAIRDAQARDHAAIAEIYAYWVRTGSASFELEAPGSEEIARRHEAVVGAGYPYLVAEAESGAVLGYAYASAYRARPAYRFTCENSVYVAPDAVGKGAGRALLTMLIARCSAMQLRQMVAVIGDSANHASIGLHRRLGFVHAGCLPSVGWKHGRWIDSVLMTLALGEGSASAPVERAIGQAV
jgi:phosphinothricin acetyltransferase